MSVRISSIDLQGFTSIKQLADFRPGALNVMIGANGAGKSNFIAFFRFLSWMTTSPPQLQRHVAMLGGANAVLHDGSAVTPQIQATVALETEQGTNEYQFRLFHAAGDTFMFAEEQFRFSRRDLGGTAKWAELGAGHAEAKIVARADSDDSPVTTTARTILSLLRRCVTYQFHNTSTTARVRQKWDQDDARWLREDGGNLAPFLMRLRDHEPPYYRRIVETIRQVAPFFADFEFEAEYGHLLLKWREMDSDMVFNASHASDGMLRAMALIALLLQPERDLPSVLILDEPELGLHPYAINVVAGLLRSASEFAQVFVATQSMTLLNYFAPEEIVVVNRHRRESLFKRLDSADLEDWLDEYSLAELWEKNVIGGRPSR